MSRTRPIRFRAERGSALLMAVFVTVLVSAMGITLLSVSQLEVRSSQANLRVKAAFFLAEGGQEDGRMALFNAYRDLTFTDALENYAGVDDTIDFDPTALQFTYDFNGNLSGIGGFGDDVPLVPLVARGDGWYAAFLTNDPAEGGTSDGDDRVMIWGIGAGPDRSVEIVQAVIETDPLVPIVPPATITILGPDPSFDGGSSDDKLYSGDDCNDPNLSISTVGVVGSTAETQAEAGVSKPGTYVSGALTGVDTVNDIEGAIDPEWKDCTYWHELALLVKQNADVVGDSTTPDSSLGTPGSPKVVYIEGDYELSGNFTGSGILWVTGQLTYNGNADWYGSLFAVGQGDFLRDGGGNGVTDGMILIADIAGADGTMWTSDDCAGADGVSGTSDDGFTDGVYLNNGGGEHITRYCQDALSSVTPSLPYKITSFRQR